MANLSDYLPRESTPTLDKVTTEGNVTTNDITVGNLTSTGINDNASSTAITIDASQHVGIGTAPTTSALTVDGGISSGSLRINNTANTANYSTISDGGGLVLQAHNNNPIYFYAGGAEVARITETGNLTAIGNVTAYSDERLKSDVETLDGSKVYDMRGVSFTKDGEAGSGVIAQELQKVAPELVHEGDEYLSVAYGNLVGYLIEAVKDLKAEVEELKGAK